VIEYELVCFNPETRGMGKHKPVIDIIVHENSPESAIPWRIQYNQIIF